MTVDSSHLVIAAPLGPPADPDAVARLREKYRGFLSTTVADLMDDDTEPAVSRAH